MSNRPTLALCIPAYNAENFLPTILTSARNQAIPFDEIIVYNDCSKDKTIEVAEKFGARVIGGDNNVGCSIGKNKLAEATTCDWIHFHDQDDDMYPNFTELAHEWIGKTNPPDVVLFDYEWREFDTKELISVRTFDKALLESDPIKYSILEQINPFCGLYNRKKFLAAGGYDTDPKVLYHEDVAFHISIAINGLSFSSESKISIINYRRENSMSTGNRVKITRAQYEVLKKTAAKVGNKYAAEITTKLWQYIRMAAFFNDWNLVSDMIKLILSLNGRVPREESAIFKKLCSINPYAAVYLREYSNRIFRKKYKETVWW